MLLFFIALVQSQLLNEFTIRPFGTLKQVFANKHSIFYEGEESNGEISKSTGQVIERFDSMLQILEKQYNVCNSFISLQGGDFQLKLNKKTIILLRSFQKQLEIQISNTESSQTTKLNYEIETNTKVRNAFLIDASKIEILIQFEDLYTVLLDKTNIIWNNDQSLININLVFFQLFQNEERIHKNSYYENLEQRSQLNPIMLIENIILRIKNEFRDLLEGLKHQFQVWTKNLNQDQEIETIYGLRQKVFYLTKSHVLIGFDTYKKDKIFRQNFDLDQSYEFVASHLIESTLVQKDDGPSIQEVRQFYFYSKEKQRLGIFLFDDDSIFQISSQQQKSQFILNFPYRIEEGPGSKDNIVILIDENLDIVTYPKIQLLNSKEIIFYHHLDRTINGYKIIDGLIFKVWSLNFLDQILMIRSSKTQDNPRVAIWDDKKVIFKLIDHSNFAVLTTDTDKLYLFIINGLTGKIIFQAYQQEIDFEKNINLVYDEHQIFVSYYNKVNLIYEIWVIEIYHPKIEFSVLKMWEYYYNKADNQPNYYKEAEPFFLSQVYGFPYSIQKMWVSKTLRSLTKKNLLILTNRGQLYSQDRNMVSSRRRERVDQVILDYNLQSAELPPYQYILFVNSHFITHSKQYEGDKYSIEPTNLESTSLFVLYGLDVYLTRISPDKQYDMLQKDFSYITLIFTIVTITLASLYMRTKLTETKQLQQFYH